jgi:hypothetical protein
MQCHAAAAVALYTIKRMCNPSLTSASFLAASILKNGKILEPLRYGKNESRGAEKGT